ncbi:membrane or secreted protein [Rhodopirellula europaea]|uniref:membrane or secreted protein n=1 Tax=Rhodopirellula europaea TaxID=1263866 RepID=UPI0030EBD5F8
MPIPRHQSPPRWTLVILMLTTATTWIGCGPSGRDLSDANWLELQQDMQNERAEVGRQRDLLEADRREWDQRERRDPVIAGAISSAAMLIACSLPLLLISVLLLPGNTQPQSESARDVLLDQVAEQRLAKVSRLEHQSDPASPERLAHREP